MTPQKRAKEEKNPYISSSIKLHKRMKMMWSNTRQKPENHLMSLISVVVTDLKHVIRDRRNSAFHTLFFFPKFWRLRHFCTFSSAQSSVSQRAQGWQGFPTGHLLNLGSMSTQHLKPLSLTNSEPTPTNTLHINPKLFQAIWLQSITLMNTRFQKGFWCYCFLPYPLKVGELRKCNNLAKYFFYFENTLCII